MSDRAEAGKAPKPFRRARMSVIHPALFASSLAREFRFSVDQNGKPNVADIINPPVYAQSASNDQDGAYINFRWDYFYNHDVTTVAPATFPRTNITVPTPAPPSLGAGPGFGDSEASNAGPSARSSASTLRPNQVVFNDHSAAAQSLNDTSAAAGGHEIGLVAQIQKGPRECVAATAKNSLGSSHGICISFINMARECQSRISGDGKGCNNFEQCCVDYSPSKEVLAFLKAHPL